MRHLDPERLAASADEPLAPDELAHLAACVPCRRERDAYVALASLAAAERDAWTATAGDAPPLAPWEGLRTQLAAEGLLVPGEHARAAAGHRRVAAPAWRRFAAAAALFLGGGLAGHLATGPWLTPPGGPIPPAPAVLTGTEIANRANDAAGPAATAIGEAPAFSSVAEATRVLTDAQRAYERAALWLADHDATDDAQSVYRARLAALDRMMAASRAGLYEAPQDPLLNQYYLAASTAREATLRQLGEALPVERVMQSF